jgi:hypothetical protein
VQRRLFDGDGGTERKQSLTAGCGMDSGEAPPPIPSGGVLPGVERGGVRHVQYLAGVAGVDELERAG